MFFHLYCSGKLFIRYNVLPCFCLKQLCSTTRRQHYFLPFSSLLCEWAPLTEPPQTYIYTASRSADFCTLLLTPDKWKIKYPKYAAQSDHNENFLGDLQPAATVTQNCTYKHRCIHTIKSIRKSCFLFICIYTETFVKAL